MKQFLKTKITIIALCVILASLLLIGCTEGGDLTYKVTFDYNYSGAPAAVEKEVDEDGGVETPADPTRDGYTFTGWYTDSSCTIEIDFNYAIEKNLTLYAGWQKSSYNITYNYNYVGAPAESVIAVSAGVATSEPSSPSRDGYVFTKWYTDAGCTTEFDFTSLINSDVTLYAGWQTATAGTYTVSFDTNYENDEDPTTREVIANTAVAKPTNPVRDGYYFVGWYVEAECVTEYNFTSNVIDDFTLYAKWFKINTIEAEYTYIDPTFEGVGYSGTAMGAGIIGPDYYNAGASNRFYVTYLYREGSKVSFEIESDKEVTDAILTLRLSAEFFDIILTDEEFLVQVNGENLSFFDLYLLDTYSMADKNMRPFDDFKITTSLHLVEGTNKIELIVNNDTVPGGQGTMVAKAPVIDCIYIYTDANLTWTDHKDNLNGFNLDF